MKMWIFSFLLLGNMAYAECRVPNNTARNAVQAVVILSEHPLISAITTGHIEHNNEGNNIYQIWVNYSSVGYADKYEVAINLENCRVMSLRLSETEVPIE